MLGSKEGKEISKADMKKKIDAWKTLNSVLVSSNAEFISKLYSKLTEREANWKQLKDKLEAGEGTEEDNAEYLFQGGYIQCLKDILNAKKNS